MAVAHCAVSAPKPITEELVAAVGNADALQTLRDAMLQHQLELTDQEGGEHPAEEVLADMRARLEARKNSV